MDELENNLMGRIVIIRVNVQEEVGRELASVYELSFTPTFIYFDAEGNELWREIGGLDAQQVYESVE